MVEVLEYSLVFLVSSAMVGFSFAALSSYSTSAQNLEGQAALSAVSAAAWDAIEHGESDVTVAFVNTTLSCSAGHLSLVSQSYSATANLPVGCEFEFSGLNGSHTLRFHSSSSLLELEVN